MSRTRFRNVCFTSYKEEPPLWNDKRMSYLVYGAEVCPNTGRDHWQGYAEFINPVEMNTVQKLLGAEKQHVEKRRGTPEQAATYCKKQDKNFKEFGVMSKQGERTDFKEVTMALANRTMSIADVARDKPNLFVQYHRGFKALEAETRTRKEFEPCHVEIWWGKTGLGKTRKWFDEHKDDGYMADNLDWWCQYKQEKFVLFDEFRCQVPISTMLKWLDGYPRTLNVKGGDTTKNWNHVVITMNENPQTLYSGVVKETRNAFARRINVVKHFTEQGINETKGLKFNYDCVFVTADK